MSEQAHDPNATQAQNITTRHAQALYLRDYEQLSYKDIAARMGITETGARGMISKERQRQVIKPVVFTGSNSAVEVPLYTGQLSYEGNCAVIGDLHLPTTRYDLLNDYISISARWLKSPRVLILAGDVFNFDALSRFDDIAPAVPLSAELRAGRLVITQLLETFDKIFWIMGNHDRRLHKLLSGDVPNDLLSSIVTPFRKRLVISPYPFMRVKSGAHTWHITHPRNYARNRLITANRLALKHQCNVISWHEHHVGVGRDEYNRYTIINGGGLHNPDMMAYVSLEDSISPVMANGFVLLLDGTGHLITPYTTLTDMARWLRSEARK